MKNFCVYISIFDRPVSGIKNALYGQILIMKYLGIAAVSVNL